MSGLLARYRRTVSTWRRASYAYFTDPEIVIADDTFQMLPKVVDIRDLTELHLLDWCYPAFPNAEELIFDALERSAYALGYVWSNEMRTFVEYAEDEA